jgi:hypothetical protein
MADNVLIATGSTVNSATVLADELTDGVLGTGKVQFMKIMDGTLDSSTKATVKAGSTAAALADTALVVALSPNTTGSENLAAIGGLPFIPKTVPATGTGLTAIPVWHNAIQLATYGAATRSLATGALTANTAKPILSFEHTAASAKTVKIRRILISGFQTTTLVGSLDIMVGRATAGATAGTVLTGSSRITTDVIHETNLKVLPTFASIPPGDYYPVAGVATAVAFAFNSTVIYDWQEGGETKPWTLRAGVSESIVLCAISTAAQNYTLSVHVTFTEE